jgi:SAM-dependent methyltransferase
VPRCARSPRESAASRLVPGPARPISRRRPVSAGRRASPSFDAKAARYDELRPVDDQWWRSFDAIVRVGDLRGRRVLEIGCGTGRLAQALAERAHARVWAVDASAEMVARTKALGINVRLARAEALPFKNAWFERAVLRMVVHLLDRPRAFGELERVVGANGRVVVATGDPDSLDEGWLPRFFPSVPEIERARFPDEDELRAELSGAGFVSVSFSRLTSERTLTRTQALETIRAKIYSTFDLLTPEEYADGLARAEAAGRVRRQDARHPREREDSRDGEGGARRQRHKRDRNEVRGAAADEPRHPDEAGGGQELACAHLHRLAAGPVEPPAAGLAREPHDRLRPEEKC